MIKKNKEYVAQLDITPGRTAHAAKSRNEKTYSDDQNHQLTCQRTQPTGESSNACP